MQSELSESGEGHNVVLMPYGDIENAGSWMSTEYYTDLPSYDETLLSIGTQ